MERAWIDDFVPVPPLCEGCGYQLEGLARLAPGRPATPTPHTPSAPPAPPAPGGPVDPQTEGGADWERQGGLCPECGRPIWSSLAARRVGSRWQRGPSLRSWLATNAAMFWSPLRVYAEVRTGAGPDEHAAKARLRNYSLLLCNALVGGVLVVAPWLAPIAMAELRAPHGAGRELRALLLTGSLAFTIVWTVGVVALTEVERLGLGFFGRQRGWRVSRAVSLAVVAHASVGWVVAGALVGTLAALPGLVRRGPNWLDVPGLGDLLPINLPLLPVAAFVAGMLVFEALTFVGVRRLRYAND